METERTCAFCGNAGPHKTTVICDGEPKTTFVPSGDVVLLGQLMGDGSAVTTVHPDISIDDISKLMSSFMDAIASFPQVVDNPMAIVAAIQKGMMP